MAYKNQKKNKRHQKAIRKQNSHKKHERERRRNEPVFVPDISYYENMMRKAGLI